MSTSPRIFALVDCNSFFASCEKVFRPDLKHSPVVVLSNNDGCVIARSSEAKELGLKMGAPYFQVKRFCDEQKVAVFSSNFALYGDMSRRVVQTLEHFTPNVEIYSIDESFLDLTGALPPGEKLGLQWCENLTATVEKWTGISVAMGVAPTKTLAKAANRLAKKYGQEYGTTSWMLLDEAARLDGLASLPLEEVWGVGRRLLPKLKQLGFQSALDLASADPNWISEKFSIVVERLVRELAGEQCYSLETQPSARKNIQISRSFGSPVADRVEVDAALANFVATGGEKLRSENSYASAVYVFLVPAGNQGANGYENWDPKTRPRRATVGKTLQLDVPTNYTPSLLESVQMATDQLFHSGTSYKKAGVIFLDLQQATHHQRTIFDETEETTAEHSELMTTIDQLNQTLGNGTVQFGTQLEGEGQWKPNSDFRSPCYTTELADLPVAFAK